MVTGQKKTNSKLVAWMVSNCHSNSDRESYAAELAKHVSVDVYGKCGTEQCALQNNTECMIMLEENYKFYLGFENSVCNDYVTEKFWKVLRFSLIPVVLGGANYSRIAPAKSYIDVRDFESVEKLADYLKYLDANVTAYAEYFEWKRFFRLTDYSKKAFCQLCQALHQDSTPKVYSNNT